MSSDEEEEICRFGTPLDPYEPDDVPKKQSKFQDITEQFAYDSNGKRRFHGAFTGGFAAGYWNTVGTPEGFTPATFKSTRENRANASQSFKPEDFMDDEDRGEFGIAPRNVQATTDFASNKRKKQEFREGPIPGDPVLHTFLQPAHETVSVKILKQMGWKPGKGVGEKVTRKERKAAKKVYTCYVPAEFRKPGDDDKNDEESSEDEDEDQYSDLLFEPDDIQPYLVKPKCDTFGIGYSGLSRHSVLGGSKKYAADDIRGQSHLVTVDKGKNVSIRGQAFGVGAFEEDDDDIYAKDDLSRYDFSLDALGQGKDKKKKNASEASTSFKNVLSGFVPASTILTPAKTYPPPALPRGYTPRDPTVRKTRFSAAPEPSNNENNQPPPEIRDRGLGRHELTADQRGNILGEERPPCTVPKAIPEKPKAAEPEKPKTYEERIAAITGRNVNFTSKSSIVILGEVEKQQQVMIDDETGKFKPFAGSPEKQKRYEEFTKCKEDGIEYKDSRESISRDNVMEWEVLREVSEFEQAHKLYRPLTGLMNERFTSAKKPDGGILDKVLSSESSQYVSADKIEAARTGRFGLLTRDTISWRPESLLCRRFNVPDPFNMGRGGQSDDSKKKSYSIFEYLESSIHNKDSYMKDQTKSKINISELGKEVPKSDTSSPSKLEEIVKKPPNQKNLESLKSVTEKFIPTSSNKPSEINLLKRSEPPKIDNTKRLTVAELFLQEKQKENEEKRKAATGKLEFNRQIGKKNEEENVSETIDKFNKIDLYKAIFLSDSESDTEKDDDKTMQEKPAQKNVERNPSPPKGIFANLNFDRLNAWQSSSKMIPEESKKIVEPKKIEETKKIEFKLPPKTIEVEDTYGPRLPEKPVFKPSDQRNLQTVMEIDDSSSSSDSWIEADKVNSNKKHKKEKKSHKKKKKKSKKSHKHKHKSR